MCLAGYTLRRKVIADARVLRIQRILMERSAVSASGHDCGLGFAFIQDSQRCQALDSLRQYEAVLRRRLEKRMSLWRKLRKQGWVSWVLSGGQPPPRQRRPSFRSPRTELLLIP